MHRRLVLRIENAGSKPKNSKNRLVFSVKLRPHAQWQVCISWIATVEGQVLPLAPQCSRVAASDWDERDVRFLSSTSDFTVPHINELSHLVHLVLQHSRADMASLRMYDLDSPSGIGLAAGVPTYMEVFGRDTRVDAA